MPAGLPCSLKLSNVSPYNLSLLRLWSRVLVSPTSNIDRVPGLRELQDASPAAKRIAIAVIDGPADLSHPAFQGADLSEVSEGVRPSRHVDASRLHGTHVASVLFGQSGGPVAGIVPACRGLLIPVFADAGDGNIRPCSEIEMARAILAALRHGANVINISAGRMSGTGTAGMHLSDAIRLCAQSGVLVVAAAGNDGCDCHQVPAALPEVLAVGAMDGRGDPVGFSNWGAAYRKGGVLAPGTDILGAEAGGGTIAMSGTSSRRRSSPELPHSSWRSRSRSAASLTAGPCSPLSSMAPTHATSRSAEIATGISPARSTSAARSGGSPETRQRRRERLPLSDQHFLGWDKGVQSWTSCMAT